VAKRPRELISHPNRYSSGLGGRVDSHQVEQRRVVVRQQEQRHAVVCALVEFEVAARLALLPVAQAVEERRVHLRCAG
jgi:hypothetical protein